MRVTARMRTVRTAVAGAALMTLLAGCVTVHGAEAVVPAVSEETAADVLADYTDVKNAANLVYDAKLIASIETGAMAAINGAGQRARNKVHPEGNPGYQPLAFSDTRYLIPRQSGWPKFFVVDTQSNRNDSRWLLVFTRNGVDEKWLASYLAVLPPADVPEFTTDEDGHVLALTPEDDEVLAMSPTELAQSYADYLQTGEGRFAEGSHTSGERANRQNADQDLASVIQRQDQAATETALAPVGLRTADGALVFFSTHHHQKQTWAEEETPVIDQYIEALLEGTATRSVTTQRTAMQAAELPAGTTPVVVHSRLLGVVTATGE